VFALLCLLLGDLTNCSENDASDCSDNTSGDGGGDDDDDGDGDGGGDDDGADGRAGRSRRSRRSLEAPFSGLPVEDSEICSLIFPEGGVPVGEFAEPSIAVQNPP